MRCPHCGQIHVGDISNCPETGKPIGRERFGHMPWIVFALTVLCVFVLSLTSIQTPRSPSAVKPVLPETVLSNPVAESLQQALRSVHRFKVRVDAYHLESEGDKVCILRGMGQFEFQGEEVEPLSYLALQIEGETVSNNPIEIYIKNNRISLSGLWLGDQWVTLTNSPLETQPETHGYSSVSMAHPYSLLATLAGISDFESDDFYHSMGLPLSVESAHETWEADGQFLQDGGAYYVYSYQAEDDDVWARILPSILIDTGIIERASSELWVKTSDYLPHLIQHRLDLDFGPVLGVIQIEINIHPYDFNLPLDLPSDLPF